MISVEAIYSSRSWRIGEYETAAGFKGRPRTGRISGPITHGCGGWQESKYSAVLIRSATVLQGRASVPTNRARGQRFRLIDYLCTCERLPRTPFRCSRIRLPRARLVRALALPCNTTPVLYNHHRIVHFVTSPRNTPPGSLIFGQPNVLSEARLFRVALGDRAFIR